MSVVRIHQGKSFSFGLRLLAAVTSIGMIVLLLKYAHESAAIVLSIMISMLPPAFWFSTKITEIDIINNKLFVGSWVMGFRKGKYFDFKKIEIHCREHRIKLTEFSLPDGKQIFTDREFRASLKVESGEHFHLFSHPHQKRVDEKIKKLKKKLGLKDQEK